MRHVSTLAASAPTARTIPAWGAAPCVDTQNARGLKARPIEPSIPHIPLVAFDPIFLQERAKLLLKIMLPMMRLLALDVLDQGLQIRRPNRERAISSLPRELRQCGRLRLEPLGRGGFNIFHQLRNSRCARQSNRQMNVVGNAPHAITLALGVANYSGKISVERRANRLVKPRCAVLRAEDHMDEQKRERLWHRSDYRSGLQPSFRSAINFLGRCPRLVYPAPSALVAQPTIHISDDHKVFSIPAPILCSDAHASRATKTPTARPIPAWGVAPWKAAPDARGLKARSIETRHTSSLEDE